MRKLLVTRESACLQPIRELIEKQKHKTLVLWSIECAERVLPIFEERHPQDERPREAVEAAKAWARGKIKMSVAKKAAHAAHNAATAVAEEDPAACAAARAMGHVVGTVHVETHAIGFVMYAITAFVYAAEQKDADNVIAKKCNWLYDRLLYWEANIDKVDSTWASFLLNNYVPNKEKLLRQKKEQTAIGTITDRSTFLKTKEFGDQKKGKNMNKDNVGNLISSNTQDYVFYRFVNRKG